MSKICDFCRGDLEKSTTEFIGKLEDRIVVISDVPALVCNQCGEAYYEPETSRNIDKVLEKLEGKKLRVHPIAAGKILYSEINELN